MKNRRRISVVGIGDIGGFQAIEHWAVHRNRFAGGHFDAYLTYLQWYLRTVSYDEM